MQFPAFLPVLMAALLSTLTSATPALEARATTTRAPVTRAPVTRAPVARVTPPNGIYYCGAQPYRKTHVCFLLLLV